MWVLVVFYITSSTHYHEIFPMKGRDEYLSLKLQTERIMEKDPTIGVKHSVICKKLDFS